MDIDYVFAAAEGEEPRRCDARFEAERVETALREFRLGHCFRDLLDTENGRSGERRLTFASFHRLFPTFPVLLVARCRYGVAQRCTPAGLFRSFGKVFLFENYLEAYARFHEVAAGRPIGLVVNFDGYRGGLVVHDGDYDTGGVRMLYDVPGGRPPQRVTVEPYVPFLRHLARGAWTPAAPLAPPRRMRRNRRPVLKLRPWMVRTLGCGPDTFVLAFLWGLLRSASGRDRRLVRVDSGERHVAIDYPELARETGLSERQVRRGVESLCGLGIISTTRRQHEGHLKTHFRLDSEALRAARWRAGRPGKGRTPRLRR